MALKKKHVEHVLVRSVDTKAVISVSTDTAEQLLRNKGEYELVKSSSPGTGDVDAAAAKAAAKAAKKAAKTEKSADGAAKTGTPVKPEWPKGSVEDWTAYAGHLGIDVTGMDRNGIHAAVVAAESDK